MVVIDQVRPLTRRTGGHSIKRVGNITTQVIIYHHTLVDLDVKRMSHMYFEQNTDYIPLSAICPLGQDNSDHAEQLDTESSSTFVCSRSVYNIEKYIRRFVFRALSNILSCHAVPD